MRKLAFLALLALASPALAGDVALGTVLGTTADAVRTALTDMGYDVRKIETEDGKIEVYFVRDGQMGEVYVSPQSGAVTKLEVKS